MDRLVDEGKVTAEEVCVFEMTERVGGRLFSLRGLGPDSDLSVDAGGYRTVRLEVSFGFSLICSSSLFFLDQVVSGLCCVCHIAKWELSPPPTPTRILSHSTILSSGPSLHLPRML
jgi:hypothetical protein